MPLPCVIVCATIGIGICVCTIRILGAVISTLVSILVNFLAARHISSS